MARPFSLVRRLRFLHAFKAFLPKGASPVAAFDLCPKINIRRARRKRVEMG